MASLQHHAAVVLTLGLLAGCGGDRSRTGAGADTAGTAVVTPDSAAMPITDTAVPSRDSARSAAPSTASDTGARSAAGAPAAKPPAKAPGAGKQMAAAGARTAHDSAAPSDQAKHDTTRVEKAESTSGAAAPAPTPQQQDTSKATAQPPEAPLRDAYHQAPRDTVSQAVYDGWKQFNLNCARCHGEDVLGTTIAPHLIVSLKPNGPINTKEAFVQTVCAGRPEKGMPAWCALGLGMDKINEIYEYVKGRSDAKIGPGRPAVKQQG